MSKQAESESKQVGRPRLYETPEDFDAKVLEYQQYCKEERHPVTWTGLALFLGFSSRQSIDEYLKYPGFSDSVKKAKLFVEWHYEMRATGNNPTGAIFILKNMGWSDKQELAHYSPDGSMNQPPSRIELVAPKAIDVKPEPEKKSSGKKKSVKGKNANSNG